MRRGEVALAVLYIGEEPFGDTSFPADVTLRESEFFSARTDSGTNIDHFGVPGDKQTNFELIATKIQRK